MSVAARLYLFAIISSLVLHPSKCVYLDRRHTTISLILSLLLDAPVPVTNIHLALKDGCLRTLSPSLFIASVPHTLPAERSVTSPSPTISSDDVEAAHPSPPSQTPHTFLPTWRKNPHSLRRLLDDPHSGFLQHLPPARNPRNSSRILHHHRNPKYNQRRGLTRHGLLTVSLGAYC